MMVYARDALRDTIQIAMGNVCLLTPCAGIIINGVSVLIATVGILSETESVQFP